MKGTRFIPTGSRFVKFTLFYLAAYTTSVVILAVAGAALLLAEVSMLGALIVSLLVSSMALLAMYFWWLRTQGFFQETGVLRAGKEKGVTERVTRVTTLPESHHLASSQISTDVDYASSNFEYTRVTPMPSAFVNASGSGLSGPSSPAVHGARARADVDMTRLVDRTRLRESDEFDPPVKNQWEDYDLTQHPAVA